MGYFSISSFFTVELFLFLVVAILAFKHKYYKFLGGLFFIYLLFFSPLAAVLLSVQERRYAVLKALPPDVATIIVLGAGGTPEVGLSVYQRLGSSVLQRCLEGVRIWKLDQTRLLVFSSRGSAGYPSQASMYADLAIAQGVDPARIFLLENGFNTESEALDFKKSFPDEKSIILVTSASHLRRASRIFSNHGLTVTPAPADFKILIHPGGTRYSFLPSATGLDYWNILIHEWLGQLWVVGYQGEQWQ